MLKPEVVGDREHSAMTIRLSGDAYHRLRLLASHLGKKMGPTVLALVDQEIGAQGLRVDGGRLVLAEKANAGPGVEDLAVDAAGGGGDGVPA